MTRKPSRPVAATLGDTLRQLRRERGMTMDALTAASGVSKSVLSQIERDQTNPTVATLLRLTEALGVSIEDVLRGASSEPAEPPAISVMLRHATPRISSADGKMVLRMLGPLSLAGEVEWYDLEAQPGAVLASEPHPAGTMEHLSVLEGEMEVTSGPTVQTIETGDTARYPADVRHVLRARGDVPVRALLLVSTR